MIKRIFSRPNRLAKSSRLKNGFNTQKKGSFVHPSTWQRPTPFRKTFLQNLHHHNHTASHQLHTPVHQLKTNKFDTIVVGGGHAGCEAAAASGRMGAQTLLISPQLAHLGVMSCNPSFGGIGKGQLIREIDALDGVMALAADSAAIHYRMLNMSKGPAVRGPRVQADRKIYQKTMSEMMTRMENVTVIEAKVGSLDIDWTNGGKIQGVFLEDEQTRFFSKAVVLTTGTFLGANIHLGDEVTSAGRMGDPASNPLSWSLHKAGLTLGRLRTGTPPRLLKNSLNFDQFEIQPSDPDPEPMSYMSTHIENQHRFVDCWIGRTTWEGQKIIQEHMALKPHNLKANNGEGIGPRYCPSLETKVQRFPDRTHNLFLEPEGLDSDLIYPNGMTLSLPRHLQIQIVRSIKGLEKAEISQFGYLVEYDYVDPRQLHHTLEVRAIPGLFLAGQINGSTGYEEAGSQGLVAGINAALKNVSVISPQGKKEFILKRSDGYAGVLIDDLVTRGADEPYRMFTSRAEFRLSLRADNADERLTELGYEFGVVSEKRVSRWREKAQEYDRSLELLQSIVLPADEWRERFGVRTSHEPRKWSAAEILSRHQNEEGICFEHIAKGLPQLQHVKPEIRKMLDINLQYQAPLQRQARDIEAFKKDLDLKLDPNIDYRALNFLSTEEKEKLMKTQPESIGQASRIQGITPASIVSLLHLSKKKDRLKMKTN